MPTYRFGLNFTDHRATTRRATTRTALDVGASIMSGLGDAEIVGHEFRAMSPGVGGVTIRFQVASDEAALTLAYEALSGVGHYPVDTVGLQRYAGRHGYIHIPESETP